MNDLILETKGVKKYFGKQLAVNDVSIHIKRNCIYGLLGPNGAGKSTILKMVTGLLHPSEGEIIVFDEPWRREALAEIGALIESPALYGNLTAVENLTVFTKMMGISKNRIDEVLEIVDLKNTGKKLASQFSMGMKQRLGIAIALLNNPKLLILDEPTNGLDPIGIEELRELICSFPKQGITVILSSHILTEVSQIVDYVGIINNGEVKYENRVSHNENIEELFMNTVRGKIV
ncbi:lantibiotic transport ATP-binding protein SrtF [Clostridium pasteurianum DSM 525 = ATCC 6013]|uniref:Lantibiotic protection ABC transporter, ATP-binding subunit n=1 Tax=Clostridium pasteurianum DSM 525 = ATCC 6013 TaxID=1262449 RepID=A0A0H3J1C5_CLOPA|nr:lantibiotic protection ABC transporter ATP-binding protein [Clostridium pasteurianum]AJA46522.1 lantibiotic transport ATP-binding protein SrtF [Clostridium pasteurianum DSM 525 = ATCC 6013]AJA50510.1 lantibiotic transport ATP-binding protein SrtF [Clostridium pasteurianum DSM 525 = ATCC 6013]AOZ73947.1 lantibiotic ABC transporter ATP-binding protein [Clostridium pasteurianum DSM 525 = ATCC 6013]AOZ77744.1 lantibiotic ABC transporter ATP-binding protein [Clostridium pasteurianum]ELP61095.1 g